ncbi:MAG TPA: GAF and ANTAR domain-containing protein [Jatrophihabitans sp.]|nr:GAF and ANTAR domain-containing protein [Jatrophihabitans sp.]
MSELDLAQTFADLALTLDAQVSVGDALDEAVRLALDTVDGADLVGISWLVQGKPMLTPASTDPLVAELDGIAFELREGPGLDAGAEHSTTTIEDMASETRWPEFARRAAERGIGSMLSCGLSSPRRTLGSLNLYARSPHAFTEIEVQIAEIYAAHASIVLASRQLESDLRLAVDSRGLIGQAIGILIERHKVQPPQAFDMLVKASQRRHVKLRDVASQLVETGVDPTR